MKPEELSRLNKDELFQMLKGKCKSKARVSLYIGLILVLLFIWMMCHYGFSNVTESTKYLVVAFGCVVVWQVLYDYLYIKRIGKLDTPDQLLYYFNKRNRSITIVAVVSVLIWLVWWAVRAFGSVESNLEYVMLAIAVAIIAYLAYSSNRSGYVRNAKDLEIIEQLEKLIEKK